MIRNPSSIVRSCCGDAHANMAIGVNWCAPFAWKETKSMGVPTFPVA